MKKRFYFLIFIALLVVSVGFFAYVKAQTPPPVCGNGVVESGETCDDGNTSSEDACSASCQPTVCGDGIIQSPNGNGLREKCEPTGGSDPFCTASCGTKIFGWGWADTFGWLSLNDSNCDYWPVPPEPVPADDFCANRLAHYVQIDGDDNLLGWAWTENLGYVCFGKTCSPTVTPALNNAQYGLAAPNGVWRAGVTSGEPSTVDGWAKIIMLGDEGWFSLNCSNSLNGDTCAVSDYKVNVGSDFFFNRTTGQSVSRPVMTGYAWHNYVDSQGGRDGLGWLALSADTIPPWLQTRFGDIYSGGAISGRAPSGAFNATYRILANGSIEPTFVSARGFDSPWVDPNYGPIDFPTPQTRYSNVLGKLDLVGLLCPNIDEVRVGTTCTNSYSRTVQVIDSIRGNVALGGDVYYVPGTLTINQAIEFKNATDFESGAGTIIINGDLQINADVLYDQNDNLNRFRNLASVAWIVRGNIIISSAVEDVVGAFISLGADGNGGTISTGASGKPLTVSGLMMARQFNLQRTGTSQQIGSELIIYDGRLLANIPPGLDDFAQALPIWRSGTFAQ